MSDELVIPDGWIDVRQDPDGRTGLEAELAREVARDHQLYGVTARAIASCDHCDDVLFELPGGRYAIVHLTYPRRAPDRPPWPVATMVDPEEIHDRLETHLRDEQPDTSDSHELAPRLVVSAGDDALDFYARAFDTEATDRMYVGGRLVNAHVLIGGTLVGVTEADGSSRSPTAIGGTPVLLSLTVPDVDAAARRFVEAGGEVVIPLDDRDYGRRDGRFRDPFGHLWILGQPLD